MDLSNDLLRFVAAGPSPYHAVAEMARRLDSAGFARLDEADAWTLDAGDRRYIVRDGGSLIAFRVGSQPVADAGVRMIGTHTDSPTLKVRPTEDIRRHGYAQVGVEPYGSPLTYTWLDRDLGIAGRLVLLVDGRLETTLVNVDQAVLRIPSLAIHLQRDLRSSGLQLDPQRHLVPVLGGGDAPSVRSLVAAAAAVDPAALLAHDLVTFDVQPPALGGVDGTAIRAPRLDNLASCHAALHALCGAEATDQTQLLVANDHEEVGSNTAEGARGSFLADTLERLIAVVDGADVQARQRALARSLLVSCDMAHAVHPNYADRHEAEHQPRLGGGPVLKVNANQSYASDATSAGWLAARSRDAGIVLQRFVTRADLPCGSTIGPLTAARLGVQTVDVGNPTLSMHSCREETSGADIAPMVDLLQAHLQAPT